MYYASIGMISLIIHVIINFEALKRKRSHRIRVSQIRYRHFLYAVFIFYVADILWGFLYGQRWITATTIDTVIFFSSMVTSVLLWTRFVVAFIENKGKFGTLLLSGGWLIFTLQLAAMVINIFKPIVFYFTDTNEYRTREIRNISLILQMVLFLITSVYTLCVATRVTGTKRAHHRTIGFSGIVMAVFVLLQAEYPLMPFYSMGCLFGTCIIHSFLYKDEMLEHFREIELAKKMAFRDPLTGVRNKLAYLELLKEIEIRMEHEDLREYGVAVFDVNNLKQINDTLGHDAGDEYIKSACRIISRFFQNSPVFRIGGDEFTVILEHEDYKNRDKLISGFNAKIEENREKGEVVIACGMEVFDPAIDTSYNDVFRRADQKMYSRKVRLKQV